MTGRQADAEVEVDPRKASTDDLLEQIKELMAVNAVKDTELAAKDTKLAKKDTIVQESKGAIKNNGYVQYLSQRCVIQHLQSPLASLRC